MFSSEHIKETQILLTAFKQYGYNIKCFKPNYDNYIKIIQFSPTLLLLELPTYYSEQIKFISLVRSHPKIKSLPIFAYGQERSEKELMYLKNNGLTSYFSRPLKFSEILKTVETILPEKVKELKKNENAIDEETDINVFKDPQIAPERKLQILTSHASSFLAFPFAVARAVTVSNDPKSGAKDLANTIMADPVISSQILKMSNTVFYAKTGDRISSIKDAIVRIGFNETRRLVLCVGVMEIFGKDDRTYGFDRKKFWIHSISVAVITEYLLSRSKYKSYAEFGFLCGLLHDFGTIALDEFLTDLFTEIVEDTMDMGGLFSEVFKNKVGFLPQDIAEKFFTEWKLPRSIIDSCSFKKRDLSNLTTTTLDEMLTLSVNTANNLAKSLSLGLSCDQMIVPASNHCATQLMLTSGLTENILDKIHQNIYEIIKFLNVEPKCISTLKNINEKESEVDIAYYEITSQFISSHFIHMKSENFRIEKMKGINELLDFTEKCKLVILYNVEGDSKVDEIIEVYKKIKTENINVMILTSESGKIEGHSDLEGVDIMDIHFDARLIEQRVIELIG